MNIIEKLGIRPLESHPTGPFKLPLYDPEEVEELEEKFNNTLYGLIGLYLSTESMGIIWKGKNPAQTIIEKVTDKSWNEIKELLS